MLYKILIRFLVMVSLPLLNACGVVSSLEHDESCVFRVPDYRHTQSCGPDALQLILKDFGHSLTIEEISLAIQKTGNCRRRFLAIFDARAREITFPAEMLFFCEKYGIKSKILNKIDDLKPNDMGLILIRKKGTLTFHWLPYPYSTNIKGFFGEKTSIYSVYLLYK